MLRVFYDSFYKLHEGFMTSLENPERLSLVLTKDFPEKLDTTGIIIPEKIMERLRHIYLGKNFYNCQECSYQAEIGNRSCVMCGNIIGKVKLVSDKDGDTTYMSDLSPICIENILKTIVAVIDLQKTRDFDSFILTRPPGHHSDNESVEGFCLINNVSFGAEYLLKNGYNKICILDWDVHHGNGTQKIFYDRDDVLFVDIHREGIYPFSGDEKETGFGKGKGYTVNIPMKKGSGEEDYLEVFDTYLLGKIEQFNPDWILVSCGFDAHKDDPIGGMLLESNSFGKMAKRLRLLGKKITYFLEGGYNRKVICDCVDSIKSVY
jgi:acetoin utilization deacetylase AcuC-like enzyme